MRLTIKPIVNGLFHATIVHEGFKSTAIGSTKDEATKKALQWLKREITSQNPDIDQDFDLKDLKNELDEDEQALLSGEFLKDKIWNGLEREIQELAVDVAKIALKAALKYAIVGSIGGAFF